MVKLNLGMFVVAVGLACFLAANPATAQTSVSIRLIDGETSRVTPAMVSIRSLKDSTLRLPPDGRAYTGRGSPKEDFYRGIEFNTQASWIGPIRQMKGQGNNDNRSYVYGKKPSVPYWKSPFAYQTSGHFSIALEPGRYQIAAMRGNEYLPIREEFDVGTKASVLEKKYVFERWINLPEQGWYSGDVHVHHPTDKPAYREFLLHYAMAEDLHMVNTLAMGHHEGVEFEQEGFGKTYRVQRGNYALVSGQEDPRGTFGHIIGLDIDEMVRDTSRYALYDLVFQGIQEQGGLVGQAHFAWMGMSMRRGFPWLVTTKMIDFIELLQFRQLNRLDYYDYLNLGFKLTAAAGSDVPWGSTLGEVRTFVYTDTLRLEIDRWFDGLEAGHTFVSNGPVLELAVEERLPGSEIQVEEGEAVTINLSAASHQSIGTLKTVRLIGSDGLIREWRLEDKGASAVSKITGEVALSVDRSQWLVASAVCDNGAVAHTSPVYLIVDGEPFYHPERAPDIIDRQLASIAGVKSEVGSWNKGAEKEGVLKRLERAAQFYRRLKQEILERR